MIKAIQSKDMVIATGSAGTGKSYLAAAYGAYYYHTGKVDKIILTKPTVAVGKGLGFLPGELDEKLAPWVAPFVQTLQKHLSNGEVECMIKNGKLEIVPFDMIRGHTFDNAFIILDEAQNCTKSEIAAFITRTGENSKVIIAGDTAQIDLRHGEKSGLEYIVDLLGDVNNEELADSIGVVNFSYLDCVRSRLCRLWIKAFE